MSQILFKHQLIERFKVIKPTKLNLSLYVSILIVMILLHVLFLIGIRNFWIAVYNVVTILIALVLQWLLFKVTNAKLYHKALIKSLDTDFRGKVLSLVYVKDFFLDEDARSLNMNDLWKVFKSYVLPLLFASVTIPILILRILVALGYKFPRITENNFADVLFGFSPILLILSPIIAYLVIVHSWIINDAGVISGTSRNIHGPFTFLTKRFFQFFSITGFFSGLDLFVVLSADYITINLPFLKIRILSGILLALILFLAFSFLGFIPPYVIALMHLFIWHENAVNEIRINTAKHIDVRKIHFINLPEKLVVGTATRDVPGIPKPATTVTDEDVEEMLKPVMLAEVKKLKNTIENKLKTQEEKDALTPEDINL